MDAAHQQQRQRQQQPSTRHSITIKPTDRDDSTPNSTPFRQAHAIQPLPSSQIPQFPPDDLLLHKDDASSKVFLALARSLLSVDNRATTVKDLADLAMNHGLGCQNTSAATQAITTYLRTHNERCELENDGPLLLSHSMSGTDADDDLIPCLYSLQGGNPKKLSPDRKTNFRKNTTVWYLSRAAGAPCPFARAGIRLCDYVGLGEEEPEKEHKRRKIRHLDPRLAGQKRKRSLRTRAAKSLSDSNSDEEEEEEEQEQRPQKKLTLRIRLNGFSATPRPQPEESQNDEDGDSSDDEGGMDVDGDETAAEPKNEEEEEWRLPPYPRRSISIPCYTPSHEASHQFPFHDPYRRSPSMFSTGSPPPDSEDEADDFHITMTRTDHLPDDFTSDEDSEGETQFESPGPRSPSAPFLPPAASVITVKEEPRDLQGLLDAWDDFDSGLCEFKEVKVEAIPTVKVEPVDDWDWDPEPTARIKQEDLSFDSLFPSESSLSPPTLSSPSSSSCLSSPDGSVARLPLRLSPRLRAKTVPVFSPQPSSPAGPSSVLAPPLPTAPADPPASQPLSPSIASLIDSMNSLCSPAITPSSLVLNSNPVSSLDPNPVVDANPPCNPPIKALQIEGISVYQMVLGSSHFLRRIDTDFVNLSRITTYTNAPLNSVQNPIHNFPCISQGSPLVTGIWVPLSVAQEYINDHPTTDGVFDIFLSDQLHERFPSALQEFVKSSAHTRSLNQFGPHFVSTLQAQQQMKQPLQNVMAMASPTSDTFSLSPALSVSEKHHSDVVEAPLNAAEQEIFELCVIPDWDQDGDAASSNVTSQRRGSAEDVDMRTVEEEEAEEHESMGGDVSDASSLTSLEDSSPEVSGEISSIKEAEDVSPSPPQCKGSGASKVPEPTSQADQEGDPEAMEEVGAEHDGGEGCNAQMKKRKAGPARTNRPLRRSKRVADLAAGHPVGTPPISNASAAASMNTRSRRRGSRNSLS